MLMSYSYLYRSFVGSLSYSWATKMARAGKPKAQKGSSRLAGWFAHPYYKWSYKNSERVGIKVNSYKKLSKAKEFNCSLSEARSTYDFYKLFSTDQFTEEIPN